MTKREMINWLINLMQDIGQTQHQDLWHYEQALDEIISELRKESEQ